MANEKQEQLSGKTVKHTPGPWEVWIGHAVVLAGPLTINTSGEAAGFTATIAECSEDNGDDEDEGKKIAAANAKLIATAPELAERLEEAVSVLRALRAGNPPPVALLDCIDSSVATLHEAGR